MEYVHNNNNTANTTQNPIEIHTYIYKYTGREQKKIR